MTTATKTRERAFLFTPDNARLTVEGLKTVTRRLVKPQPQPDFLARGVVDVVPQWPEQDGVRWFMADGLSELVKCPYGKPGDRFRVLTTWAVHPNWDSYKPKQITKVGDWWDASQGPKPDWCGKSRPGRFCPLHLRHHLPLCEWVSVGVERLQEITFSEIEAEGFHFDFSGEQKTKQKKLSIARYYFTEVWDRLNPKNPMASNPHVWRLEYKHLGA